MPTVKAGKSRQVVIPKGIWDDLQLQSGDYFEVKVAKGTITFIPKKLVERDPWYWSKEVQKSINEALDDIKAGRVKEFSNVDDLIKDLES